MTVCAKLESYIFFTEDKDPNIRPLIWNLNDHSINERI